MVFTQPRSTADIEGAGHAYDKRLNNLKVLTCSGGREFGPLILCQVGLVATTICPNDISVDSDYAIQLRT